MQALPASASIACGASLCSEGLESALPRRAIGVDGGIAFPKSWHLPPYRCPHSSLHWRDSCSSTALPASMRVTVMFL